MNYGAARDCLVRCHRFGTLLACLLVIGVADARTITFLGDRDLAPYEFLVNGIPRGANVDLAHAIGRVLGREIRVELVDWSEAQARVRDGRGDALTMLGHTPEREKDFAFTQPTLPVAFALFIRAADEPDYTDGPLDAVLRGRRIGVTAAGLARSFLERNYPDAEFVIVENLLDGTRRLASRDIDAFGAQVWSENFLLSELGIRGIKSLPPFADRHGNIAVRAGNEELRRDIDRAVAELKASGELDRIISRWTTTRLRLVSESTLVALAVTGGVAGSGLLLLTWGLLWSRRQKAALQREIDERSRAEHALRQSELALQEADKRKDLFIATLAHELRNPLAPISNAVQMLELKGGESVEARWAREVISRQSGHLTRLIDDLLDVGRITSGKMELRREPVALRDVIRDAVEVSRPVVEKFHHRLDVDQPTDPVWLDVDRARLVQVVMNLLTNAAKYSPVAGPISLIATMEADDAILRVVDQGVGISQDRLNSIFEMFYQEDRARSHAGGGLGIGLWLTQQLVQMHGGVIQARSAGADRGAEFVVRLPGVRCAAPVGPVRGREEEDRARALRVLVVDDNVDSAESTSLLLAMLGHEVSTAFDGAQALAEAGRTRPHLVLLDLAMPKLSGFEVCQRLRAIDWGRETVVVAMTGWGGKADKAATQQAGFDDHLVKPIDIDALTKLLRSIGGDPRRASE
jgi:signal transduction histidine kinase/CheY-like chemotaxis protein